MGAALGLALGAAQAIAGGEYNARQQEAQHYYNLKEAQENTKTNYKYNEMAADNADKRQRALYEDYLSYKAQVRMMRDAGLSPALMYGGAGAGAGSMPSGASGGASGGATGVGMGQLSMPDLASIGAQSELIQSQVNKNNAEADSTRGAKGTIGAAQINALAKEAELKTAQTIGLQIENGTKKKLNEEQIKLIQAQSAEIMQNVKNSIMEIQIKQRMFRLETERFKEQKRQFGIQSKTQSFQWSKQYMLQRDQFNKSINTAMERLQKQLETTISEGKAGRKNQTINGIMRSIGGIVEGLILGALFKGGSGALKAGMIMTPSFNQSNWGGTDAYGHEWL